MINTYEKIAEQLLDIKLIYNFNFKKSQNKNSHQGRMQGKISREGFLKTVKCS